MFADITESSSVSIIVPDGFKLNGNGHTYTYTNTAGDCFKDNGVQIYADFLDFFVQRTAATATGKIFLLTSSGGSTINCHNTGRYTMTIAGGAHIVAGISGVNDGTFIGLNIKVVGNGTGIYTNNANTSNVINCYVEVTGSGTAIDALTSGTVINSVGISNTGIGINAATRTDKSEGVSTTNYGIYTNTGVINNSVGISTSGTGLYAGSSNANNSVGISTSGQAFHADSGNNCTGKSSSGYAVREGGTYRNCYFESVSNMCQWDYSGVYTNCSIVTKWNNTGGHALSFGNSGSIVCNCFIQVANASAYCITGLSAYMNGNCYRNSTSGTNNTQLTTTTESAQGNIII